MTELLKSKDQDNRMTTQYMNEQTLNQSPKIQSTDLEYGFWTQKLKASTQIKWIRWRGIQRTRRDDNDYIGILFEKSLQDWDIWYDYDNNKIRAYASWRNISWIQERWLVQRSYAKWEYVLHNWILYRAIQDSNYTEEPWTPAWDWYWEVELWYQTQVPYDNISWEFSVWAWWFTSIIWWSSIPWAYQLVDSNGNIEDIWWEIVIPSTWYYILNTREQRWARPWWTNIATRLQLSFNWVTRSDISVDYNYSNSISGTDINWDPVNINQWVISNDTTMNTRVWYLKKWWLIRVQFYSDIAWIDIDYDNLQITRLF